MNYRELAILIATMTEEQKDQTATVYVSGVDEYYPLVNDHPIVTSTVDDVLDEGHYYMVI
jgi:hypothetical protein